jgi:ankyrin repeat protein
MPKLKESVSDTGKRPRAGQSSIVQQNVDANSSATGTAATGLAQPPAAKRSRTSNTYPTSTSSGASASASGSGSIGSATKIASVAKTINSAPLSKQESNQSLSQAAVSVSPLTIATASASGSDSVGSAQGAKKTANVGDNGNIDAILLEKSNSGMNPLWKAAIRQDWATVKKMIEQGARSFDTSPTEGPNRGVSTLWWAAANKQWPLVELMVKQGARSFDAVPAEGPSRGKSTLWWAAANKQWPLVELMVKQGATSFDTSPAEGPNRGTSTLWLAVSYLQWPLAKMMLEQGARSFDAVPAEGPNRGISTLWGTVHWLQWSLVETMLKHGAKGFDTVPTEGPLRGKSMLWETAVQNQWHLVEMMLEKGARSFDTSPPEGLNRGKSTLWYASYAGAAGAVRMLLGAGASLDIPSLQRDAAPLPQGGDYGATQKLLDAAGALFKAASEKTTLPNFMESLKTLGRAVNGKRKGFTALGCAIIAGQDIVAEQLLYQDADLDIDNLELSKSIAENPVFSAFAKVKMISNSLAQLEMLSDKKSLQEKESQDVIKRQSELSGEIIKRAQELLDAVKNLTAKARSQICYRLALLLEKEPIVRTVPGPLIFSAFLNVNRNEVQQEDYEHAQAQIVHYGLIIKGKASIDATAASNTTAAVSASASASASTAIAVERSHALSLDESEQTLPSNIELFGSALNAGSKIDDGLVRILGSNIFKGITDNPQAMETNPQKLHSSSDPKTEIFRTAFEIMVKQKKEIAELKQALSATTTNSNPISSQVTPLASINQNNGQTTPIQHQAVGEKQGIKP